MKKEINKILKRIIIIMKYNNRLKLNRKNFMIKLEFKTDKMN